MTPVRVLIVEDSTTIRSLVRRMLVAGGHEVLEAADGPAALTVLAVEHPDVVLLDVEMPQMSGWEVLAAIKADPSVADIPVVFLTGRLDTADMVEGLRLGAHDYLRKPCEPAELLARVQAAARVNRLQEELRRRNEELDRAGRTDGLTGLSNRRDVEGYLRQQVSLGRRNASPVAVLLFDVDHFKRVNDTYGHAGGDAVLREVASRLAGHVRLEDTIGRWGGEEFLAVLPMTTAAEGSVVAERVRAALAARPCPLSVDGVGEVAVTISVGCAAGTQETAEELVARADSALYEAKEAGRNRVVIAEAVRRRPVAVAGQG